jgi:WD40 repeat protein
MFYRAATLAIMARGLTSAADGQPHLDALGDLLPDGAVARLGTTRFQHVGARCIDAVVFSPDGKMIASTDGSGKRILWDAATGKQLRVFAGEGNVIAWVDQGKVLLCVKQDGSVCWCDAETGRLVRSWNPFAGERKLTPLKQQLRPVCSGGAVTRDADLLAVTLNWVDDDRDECENEDLVILDLVHRKEGWRLPARDKWTTAYAFSPDGKHLVIQCSHGEVVDYDALTGKSLQRRVPATMSKKWELSNALAFAPDGSLATAELNGSIAIWSFPDFKKQRTLATGNDLRRFFPIGSLAFSPDGKSLAIAFRNRLCLLDTVTRKEQLVLPGHDERVKSVAFSSNGRELLTGCRRKQAFLMEELLRWQVGTWNLTGSSVLNPSQRGIISADHLLLIDTQISDLPGVFEQATKKRVTRLQLPIGSQLADGFFSPGGHFVVARYEEENNERMGLFDTATGALLWSPDLNNRRGITFSSDDRWMAIQESRQMGRDSAKVFETATGKVCGVCTNPGWGATAATNSALVRAAKGKKGLPQPAVLALSPDGAWLAAWFPGRRDVQVWTVADGKKRFEVRSEERLTGSVNLAWSPDGRMLAVSGLAEKYRIQLWETLTARLRRELPGHDMRVTALAFSPDCRWLASGSEDTTVLVWNGWE